MPNPDINSRTYALCNAWSYVKSHFLYYEDLRTLVMQLKF